MKKLSVCLTLILIVAMLAIPALAAQTATATVTTSAATVAPGGTITVTVSMSKVDNCTSGGFLFTYDKSIFDYVSGENLSSLSGYTAGVSTAAGNVAGYFMAGSGTVQGDIFRITLKVKDTAPSGNYTISGTPSLTASDGTVACSVKGATVSVGCEHAYGSWSDDGNGQHSKTCKLCQAEEVATHTWNSGAVTKEATCKEVGQKTYTCIMCSATETEAIAKLTTHTYGAWTKDDDTNHKRSCTVCQIEETADHTWNSGTTTKAATCKDEGEKTYTCTGCAATKTEPIAKLTTHTYGAWTKDDDTNHKRSCTVCQDEQTGSHAWNGGTTTKAATCKDEGEKTYTCTVCKGAKVESLAKLTTHTYDNACDTDCNVCSATRAVTHDYGTEWSKDEKGHWHVCSVCKAKKDDAAHIPGAAATETTAQTCTACGYIIQPAVSHKHSYATTWTTNDEGHWHACAGCEEKDGYAAHSFDNDCDTDCAVCGYTRATQHKFTTWKYTQQNHWQECACGAKNEAEDHAWVGDFCSVCGAEDTQEPETTAPATEPTEPDTTEPAATEGADPTEVTVPATTKPSTPADDTKQEGNSPVVIIVAIVLVLVAGAAVALVLKKKK